MSKITEEHSRNLYKLLGVDLKKNTAPKKRVFKPFVRVGAPQTRREEENFVPIVPILEEKIENKQKHLEENDSEINPNIHNEEKFNEEDIEYVNDHDDEKDDKEDYEEDSDSTKFSDLDDSYKSDDSSDSYDSSFQSYESEESSRRLKRSKKSEKFLFDKLGKTFYKKDNPDCYIQYSFSYDDDGKNLLVIDQFICEEDVKNIGKWLLYHLIIELQKKHTFDNINLTAANFDSTRLPRGKTIEDMIRDGFADKNGNFTEKFKEQRFLSLKKNYEDMNFEDAGKDEMIGETNELLRALEQFQGGFKKGKTKKQKSKIKKQKPKQTKKRRKSIKKNGFFKMKRKTKRRTQRKRK
jgi:hypothetical protein